MYFKNSTHEYFVNDKKYISFSALKKLIEPVKDWDKIAEAYAKKHKMTKDQVQTAWAEKGRISREKGTLIHAYKEDLLKADKLMGSNEAIYFTEESGDMKPIKSIENLPDGIYPELILYNNEYQVCGTADKVIIETVDGIRYVDVEDYKTNEEIKLESYFNPRSQTYDMLLHPCNNLMDCNYSTYALQLSTYAYFLERYNYTPRHLTLIHLIIAEADGENEAIIEHEGKKYYIKDEVYYDVKYLRKEVKALLQYYKIKTKQEAYVK